MPKRSLFVGLRLIVICGSVAVAEAARSPISLEVLHRDGYGSVQLINGANKLFVRTLINGEKIDLLLDTGWGAQAITLGVNPARLHIVPEKGGGSIMSASGARTGVGRGVAQSMVMGNVHLNGVPVFFGRFVASGFLGRGFLRTNSAIIDLTNLRLYLRPPGKGSRVDLTRALTGVGMNAVPFSELHGNLVLNVEVNGVPAQMALDTGAQVSVLDTRFAKQVSARGWGRHARSRDAAGRLSAADLAGTKSFKIEGNPIRTPTVLVTNFAGYDMTRGKIVGLLGLDVLGMNWGIIDVGQNKLYFAKAR
jgi:predicted aspartyl protease